jgi:hypothetical protein
VRHGWSFEPGSVPLVACVYHSPRFMCRYRKRIFCTQSMLAGREHHSVRWGADAELIAGGVLPGAHRSRGKVNLDLT